MLVNRSGGRLRYYPNPFSRNAAYWPAGNSDAASGALAGGQDGLAHLVRIESGSLVLSTVSLATGETESHPAQAIGSSEAVLAAAQLGLPVPSIQVLTRAGRTRRIRSLDLVNGRLYQTRSLGRTAFTDLAAHDRRLIALQGRNLFDVTSDPAMLMQLPAGTWRLLSYGELRPRRLYAIDRSASTVLSLDLAKSTTEAVDVASHVPALLSGARPVAVEYDPAYLEQVRDQRGKRLAAAYDVRGEPIRAVALGNPEDNSVASILKPVSHVTCKFGDVRWLAPIWPPTQPDSFRVETEYMDSTPPLAPKTTVVGASRPGYGAAQDSNAGRLAKVTITPVWSRYGDGPSVSCFNDCQGAEARAMLGAAASEAELKSRAYEALGLSIGPVPEQTAGEGAQAVPVTVSGSGDVPVSAVVMDLSGVGRLAFSGGWRYTPPREVDPDPSAVTISGVVSDPEARPPGSMEPGETARASTMFNVVNPPPPPPPPMPDPLGATAAMEFAWRTAYSSRRQPRFFRVYGGTGYASYFLFIRLPDNLEPVDFFPDDPNSSVTPVTDAWRVAYQIRGPGQTFRDPRTRRPTYGGGIPGDAAVVELTTDGGLVYRDFPTIVGQYGRSENRLSYEDGGRTWGRRGGTLAPYNGSVPGTDLSPGDIIEVRAWMIAFRSSFDVFNLQVSPYSVSEQRSWRFRVPSLEGAPATNPRAAYPTGSILVRAT